MERELFVVEKLRGGQWVPRPSLVSLTGFLNEADCVAVGQRIVKYVPEDPTPRLMADWQRQNDGEVIWDTDADDGLVLCLLKSGQRVAVGKAEALDPFGAARAALANWESQWGAT